jgi:hypothetical protein
MQTLTQRPSAREWAEALIQHIQRLTVIQNLRSNLHDASQNQEGGAGRGGQSVTNEGVPKVQPSTPPRLGAVKKVKAWKPFQTPTPAATTDAAAHDANVWKANGNASDSAGKQPTKGEAGEERDGDDAQRNLRETASERASEREAASGEPLGSEGMQHNACKAGKGSNAGKSPRVDPRETISVEHRPQFSEPRNWMDAAADRNCTGAPATSRNQSSSVCPAAPANATDPAAPSAVCLSAEDHTANAATAHHKAEAAPAGTAAHTAAAGSSMPHTLVA